MGRLVLGEAKSEMKRSTQRQRGCAVRSDEARWERSVDEVEWNDAAQQERPASASAEPLAIDVRDVVVGCQPVEQIATSARASLARVI